MRQCRLRRLKLPDRMLMTTPDLSASTRISNGSDRQQAHDFSARDPIGAFQELSKQNLLQGLGVDHDTRLDRDRGVWP